MPDSDFSDVGGLTAEDLLAHLPQHEKAEEPDEKILATVKSEDLVDKKKPEAEANSEDESPEGEGTPEPEDKPEPEEPEAEDEEQDKSESDPLLVKLAERGLGTFKTVDDALDSFKAARTRLSQRDEFAITGRLAAELGVSPDDLRAWANNGTPETKDEKADASQGVFKPPHTYNPAWELMIREKVDDEGKPTGEFTGPPSEVSKFLEYRAYEQSFWDRVRRDPSALVNQESIAALIKKGVNDELKARQQKEVDAKAGEETEKFLAEHGEYLEPRMEEFLALVEQGNDPDRLVAQWKLEDRVKELEGKPAEGEDAVKRDLAKKTERTTRRAAAKTTPIRTKEPEPAELARRPDDLLKRAMSRMAESDEEVPAQLSS